MVCIGYHRLLIRYGNQEMMVTAPVIVFLYDRTFLARRLPRGMAAALAMVYCAGFHLDFAGVADYPDRQPRWTAGFGTEMSSWHYALTQCRAVVRYFWLVFCLCR